MSIIYNGIYYLMYGFLILISINIIAYWIPPLYRSRIFRSLRKVTDTYMEPFHGIIVFGFFDFSPIIGIILFELLIQAYIYLVNSAWL